MKNVLVNFSYGDKCIESIDGDIFLNSMKKYKTFEKVCFVNQVSEAAQQKLRKYFDILVPTDERIYTAHLAIYEWLIQRQNQYKYVLQSDLRDVVLQRDPFEFFEFNPQYDMFYTLEGMPIKDNDCNMFWHDSYIQMLRSHNKNYSDSMIINGGIVAGKIESYCNHLLMIFTNTNRLSKYLIQDQQFMGYLYQFIKDNPRVLMSHPYSDTFCCTGEAIKRDNVKITFDGTNACNLNGEPYYIFHQWDRTEFANQILDKEKSTLRFSF